VNKGHNKNINQDILIGSVIKYIIKQINKVRHLRALKDFGRKNKKMKDI